MNERARQRAHTVHNMETKLLGVVLQGMPVEHMAPILPRHMRGSTTSGQRQLDIAAISSMAALTGNTREQPAAPGKTGWTKQPRRQSKGHSPCAVAHKRRAVNGVLYDRRRTRPSALQLPFGWLVSANGSQR